MQQDNRADFVEAIFKISENNWENSIVVLIVAGNCVGFFPVGFCLAMLYLPLHH